MEEQFGFDHASALVFASGMPNQMLTNALNRQGGCLRWLSCFSLVNIWPGFGAVLGMRKIFGLIFVEVKTSKFC